MTAEVDDSFCCLPTTTNFTVPQKMIQDFGHRHHPRFSFFLIDSIRSDEKKKKKLSRDHQSVNTKEDKEDRQTDRLTKNCNQT